MSRRKSPTLTDFTVNRPARLFLESGIGYSRFFFWGEPDIGTNIRSLSKKQKMGGLGWASVSA
jgi:hypothetical protein